MLDIIRKRKRSWLILLLLGVGVLAFVMVGVYPQGDYGSVVTIAEVNGDKITAAELEGRYQRLLQTYQELLRGSLTPGQIAQLDLRGEVLNELIQQKLLLQEARKLGLYTTDDELATGIATNPAFQIGGRFNQGAYRQTLRRQGLSPAQFEAQQRDALTIQKLFQLVQDSLPVTEDELKDRYKLDNEQINLEFIRLETNDFLSQVEVTDEEITDYYEKNKAQFREPLKVKVDYIHYPTERFGADVEVPDEAVEEYYNVYRDRRFREPEQVRFRQIFMAIPNSASADDKAEVREHLNKVLQELRSGSDFAELAKEYSQDASASQGGDMGFVGRGRITPSIEKVVFELEPGKFSEILETPYGLHIVKVEEKRPEKIRELDEVRDEIVTALKGEKGNERAARAIEEDRERTLDGVPFKDIATNRGLEVKTSPGFGAGEKVDEIGDHEDFYRTALSLRTKGQVAPIVQGTKGFYLFQLAERIDPRIPPLEKVKDRVKENVRRRKARALAEAKAKTLLDELKPHRLEDVAQKHGLATEETGLFPRRQRDIPKLGSLETAQGPLMLSKEKPRAEVPIVRDDVIYVVALKDSVPANLKDFPQARKALSQQVLEEKRRRALQRLIESLKKNAEIEIRPEFI